MRNVAYGLIIAGLCVACGDDNKKPAPEKDAGDDVVPLDGSSGADAGGDGDGEVDTRECAQLYDGFGPYEGATTFVTPAEFDACNMACQLPAGSTDAQYEECWAANCAPNVGNSYACYNDTLVSCYTRADGGVCHMPTFTNFVCCSEETCNKDTSCIEEMCTDEYDAVIQCVLDDWGATPNTPASDVCFAQLLDTCFAPEEADGGPGDGDTGDLDAGTTDAGQTDDASVSPRPTLPRAAIKASAQAAKRLQIKRSFVR